MSSLTMFGILAWIAVELSTVPPAGTTFPVARIPSESPFAATTCLTPQSTVRAFEGTPDQSGPRFAMTTVFDPQQVERLNARGLEPTMNEYGWQFERQLAPLAGSRFVVEARPMVGGFESGKFLPSLTLTMGIRSPSGTEVGFGPSFAAQPEGVGNPASLVVTVGRSLNCGLVRLPLEAMFSMAPEGQRASLVLGCAFHPSN